MKDFDTIKPVFNTSNNNLNMINNILDKTTQKTTPKVKLNNDQIN